MVVEVLITNSAEQNPSWEADSCLATQEISRLWLEAKVHYHVHKSTALNPLFKSDESSTLSPSYTTYLTSVLIVSWS
jgi:hypothetical protein